MADPLSVAASIAGLISITVEAGKFLRPYVSAARETPPIAAHVYSEVQSIEIILNGLQNVTSSLSSVHSRNAALIGVNQVITVLTDGVLLFSDLQDELRSLSPKNEDDGIPMRTRLRWVRKEGTLTALLTRLQGFKSSMTLVLMILKSDSDRSATQHHEQLSANINLLLESNQSLSRRLMNLEEAMDTATIASRRMSFLTLVEDTSQGIASEQSHPSIAETDSTIGVSKFDFEDDLEASRAYRRAQRDTMDFSFRSSIARSNSWSVFSGLSLGDISIMAVIALPVYQEDLANPEHYDFGNDPVVVAKEPEPTIERPLLYLDSQEKTNTEQTKDILMSKGSLHQAAARIGEAVKDEANREIVKDLNLCMDDWKGHVLAAFGDLTLFDFISITKNNNTKPVSISVRS
ncbi:hypothetical protein ACHAPY_004388 [Fusarium culmorum]